MNGHKKKIIKIFFFNATNSAQCGFLMDDLTPFSTEKNGFL